MYLPSIALCVLTVSKEEQRLHLPDWSSHLPSHITFSTGCKCMAFLMPRMLTALLYFNNTFLENTSALMLVIESQRCRLTPLFLHYLHLCFFHPDEILYSGFQMQEVMVVCQWFLARGEINKTVGLITLQNFIQLNYGLSLGDVFFPLVTLFYFRVEMLLFVVSWEYILQLLSGIADLEIVWSELGTFPIPSPASLPFITRQWDGRHSCRSK